MGHNGGIKYSISLVTGGAGPEMHWRRDLSCVLANAAPCGRVSTQAPVGDMGFLQGLEFTSVALHQHLAQCSG